MARGTFSSHSPLTRSENAHGMPEAEMKRRDPKTFAYLKRFEDRLRARSGFKQYFRPTDPFYSIYNVGPYTMADWKVLWPEVGHTVRAGVCGLAEVEAVKLLCRITRSWPDPVDKTRTALRLCVPQFRASAASDCGQYRVAPSILTCCDASTYQGFNLEDQAHTRDRLAFPKMPCCGFKNQKSRRLAYTKG